MIWIPIAVFALVLLAVVGGYFLLSAGRGEKAEVKRRISLLELRNLQDADVPDFLKKEVLSEVPLFNRLLSRVDVAATIDRRLRQADMKMPVGTFLLLSLVLFFVGIVAGRILHWPTILSIVVGIALLAVPNLIVDFKRRRRLKRFMNHFPEALEMFARSLRAGHSFTGAIQLVAQEMPDPIGPEFSKVFEEQNLGIPLRQALIGMTDRVDILDVKFFVTAILIQRKPRRDHRQDRLRDPGTVPRPGTAQDLHRPGANERIHPFASADRSGCPHRDPESGVPETALVREGRKDHDRRCRDFADPWNAGHSQDHPDQDLRRGDP
jgi:tight adherence protein B